MSTVAASLPATSDDANTRTGWVRWSVCALIFLATTINYIDRQILGILAPTLQHDIGWNEIQYGHIVTAFYAAYALGLLVVGVLGLALGLGLVLVALGLGLGLDGGRGRDIIKEEFTVKLAGDFVEVAEFRVAAV